MLKELKSEIAVYGRWTFFLCQDQNVFDSKKKVKLTNAEGVEFKLSKKQLQAIEFNKALLAMYTNQVGNKLPIPLVTLLEYGIKGAQYNLFILFVLYYMCSSECHIS